MIIPADCIWTEQVRVKSYETDFQQRWKPVCFFQRMQEAANDHNSQLGFDFQELAARDILWTLSRLKIYFYEFPRLGDEAFIRTWPKGRQQRLFYLRDFEFLKPDGSRYAAATSAWLLMDAKTRRLHLPQALPGLFPDNGGLSAVDVKLERIPSKELDHRTDVTAKYSEIDMAGYMNASRYISWICNTLPIKIFQEKRMRWLQINYLAEVKWDEHITIASGIDHRDESIWYFQGENHTSNTMAFNATCQWVQNQDKI